MLAWLQGAFFKQQAQAIDEFFQRQAAKQVLVLFDNITIEVSVVMLIAISQALGTLPALGVGRVV